MKKVSFVLIILFLGLGCSTQQIAKLDVPTPTFQTKIIVDNSSNDFEDKINAEYQEAMKNYPGRTIDQIFPIIESHDFMEEDFKQKTYTVNAEGFQVGINNFTPKTISKNGKHLFKFITLTPREYSSNLVGISHLLGKNSKQIYVVANGPGGVCCTNYWITDVSSGTPRNIYRSEDFGSFRDPMEIFDSDGDGIYELMQWDSAFRYFMDDCGSCSPEPRAIFKYDKKTQTYLPAKGVQQDFVKEGFLKTEKWLAETFEKLKTSDDPGEELNFHRSLLAHIVDLFYLGEERKAWKTFDKYFSNDSHTKKIRDEIKSRLRQSKFYQALEKN